jgi:AraC family transcriptional activator FtrA
MRKNPAGGPKVAVVVGQLVNVFELGVPCEIFGTDRSYLGVPWYRFAVCAEQPGPLPCRPGGFEVLAHHDLGWMAEAHTIVVPPFATDREPPPAIVDALRAAHRRGARILSLCTGAFVLAAAGLLDGRRATVHWSSADELARRYPAVRVDPAVLYVDEGDILTSAGTAAGIDLCLYVVRRDYGADVANHVARDMVVPPHRDGGQAQFVDRPVPVAADGDPFAGTLAWAAGNLSEPLTVAALARKAAMSPRSFARRFLSSTGVTPHQWLIRQRVQLAQRLLETTELSIDEVARQCGLGSAASLRQNFAAILRTSPAAYRRTFRTAGDDTVIVAS